MTTASTVQRNYVVIEGNIGSGKTSLAKILADKWNARLMLEQFSDNPFLPKFYQNPERHAFALELSFLAERYHQNRNELGRTDLFKPCVVADYSFAKSLIFAAINLPEDEFELYRSLFQIIHGRLPRPDLLVYLHCSEEKSMRHIQKRGRDFEQEIDIAYLMRITAGYLDSFRQQPETPILIIDTEQIDFVSSQSDLSRILSHLQKHHSPGITFIDPLNIDS
ncbi:MAG: deoxynucleoside kinase [Flavobacteriales bacterium]|nr:deoxynucleoside kinase [Flavobacteriales bacterium]